MSRFSDTLRVFIRLVVWQAWAVVILALVVSVVGFWFARQLRIDTDFSNLVPREYPSVQALEALRETVGSEATVDVAIVSPSFEANRAFAILCDVLCGNLAKGLRSLQLNNWGFWC